MSNNISKYCRLCHCKKLPCGCFAIYRTKEIYKICYDMIATRKMKRKKKNKHNECNKIFKYSGMNSVSENVVVPKHIKH